MEHVWPSFENADVEAASNGWFQFDLKVHRLWERKAIVEKQGCPGYNLESGSQGCGFVCEKLSYFSSL